MGGDRSGEFDIESGFSRRRFVTRTAAAAGAAWVVPSIITATPAFAQGSQIPNPGEGGSATEIQPPQTTVEGAVTSDTETFYWLESGPTVLGAPQPVNRDGSDGSFGGGSVGAAYDIPAGTTLYSFFIHADRLSAGNLAGSLTFGGGFTIAGLSWRVPALTASAAFEFPGTAYSYYTSDGSDQFQISGGGTTFSWDFAGAAAVDQVRLFIAA
jgi:hypothetical protein